jgi:hypothetical protein
LIFVVRVGILLWFFVAQEITGSGCFFLSRRGRSVVCIYIFNIEEEIALITSNKTKENKAENDARLASVTCWGDLPNGYRGIKGGDTLIEDNQDAPSMSAFTTVID